MVVTSGCSGLAVACLAAVREVLRSNRAVDSCVYRKNHCELQPWARAVCTFHALPRSTQPSTLRGTVNEYQLFGLSNNNKWRWWL